jgi:hypothetical protein
VSNSRCVWRPIFSSPVAPPAPRGGTFPAAQGPILCFASNPVQNVRPFMLEENVVHALVRLSRAGDAQSAANTAPRELGGKWCGVAAVRASSAARW